MFAVLLLFFLQNGKQRQSPPPNFLVTPADFSKHDFLHNVNPDKPILAPPSDKTTPHLSVESDLATHAQMERDLGSQSSDIGWLKSKVDQLEKLRSDPDRKDIESLKDTRTYISILLSFIGGAGAILFGLRNAIWFDMLRPRVKRLLEDHPSVSVPPDSPH